MIVSSAIPFLSVMRFRLHSERIAPGAQRFTTSHPLAYDPASVLSAMGQNSMSMAERQARADAVYDELRVLAEQEEVPAPLTAVDTKRPMNLNSDNQYLYNMRLWNRCVR
jgi:hypothetical protein